MPEEIKPTAVPAQQSSGASTPSATPAKTVVSTKSAVPAAKAPPSDGPKVFDMPDDLGIEEPTPQSGGNTNLNKPTSEAGDGQRKPVPGQSGEGGAMRSGSEAEKPVAGTTAPQPGEAPPKAEPNKTLGEVVKPDSSTRDYTGFTQDEVHVLKNMSKQSFDYVAKVIKENKELAKLKDSTYLQSPEAYKLDPQYNKTVEDISYLSQEAQIWRNQLINIKTGKEWAPFKGWDKQGNPVFDAKRAPGEMDEEDVRQRMMLCENSARQSQEQLSQLQQNYVQRVQSDNAKIDEVQSQKFSWVSDPAQLEKTVSIPNIGDRTVKQIREDFMSLLPAYHRPSKLAELGANMFAALQIYSAEIKNLQAQLQVAETKRADALRAEPTSTEKPTNTNGVQKSKFGGPAVFDLAGLPD